MITPHLDYILTIYATNFIYNFIFLTNVWQNFPNPSNFRTSSSILINNHKNEILKMTYQKHVGLYYISSNTAENFFIVLI